jgi:UPF0755 protein
LSWLRNAALALLVCSVLAVIALGWLVVVYPAQRSAGASGKAVSLDIDAATNLQDIADALASKGLVKQPQVFALYARVMGAASRLHHGRVLLTDAMSMRELLQRIARGFGATELRITIPEGFSRFEIADRLAAWDVCEREDFLAVVHASDAEGWLFPDTYRIHDRTSARQVVARMRTNGHKRLLTLLDQEASSFARLRSELGLDLRGLVTLASIVEKEAHLPSEQPIIAGVFWNRLRDPAFRPKRLQADPTVAYGCRMAPELASCTGFDGHRVTRAMTGDPQNVYNTYRRDGLPPGPIANPGLAALRAMLHPAQHDYFYFVARGDGSHRFSATLTAHNDAVSGQPRSP